MGHHRDMSQAQRMPSPRHQASTTSPSVAARAYVIGAVVLAVLVFIQAVLAGRYTSGLGTIVSHGHVGNASFVVGLAVALLAFAARVGGTKLTLAAVVLLLLFTQTGMGYMARTMPEAGAWHVPLGVLTFALVLLQAVGAAPIWRGGSGSSS